jgi:outer membrane protein TolC
MAMKMNSRFLPLRHGAAPVLYALALGLSLSAGAEPVAVGALVDEALAHNPDLLAARLEFDAARERRAPAGALEDPMLEAGVQNAALPFSLRREDMTMTMLGLSQKLPYPGKRALREAVASAEADASGHAVAEARLRLVRDVHLAYEDLRLADRSAAIVAHTQETLRVLAASAASRYALGQGRQGDAWMAGTRGAELGRELLRLRTERATAEAELRRLLGRTDATHIEPIAHPLVAEAAPAAPGVRPQLAALEALESRGALAVALAEREYYPDIEVRLGYGHRERSLEGMPRDDVVSLTFAVNLPLWRRDRLQPRVAEARAERARAAALAASQRLETRASLERETARIAEARDTEALVRTTLRPQARAAADSARAAWESGTGSLAEVLEALLREYDSDLLEATAEAAAARARAEIAYLGGVAPDVAPSEGHAP